MEYNFYYLNILRALEVNFDLRHVNHIRYCGMFINVIAKNLTKIIQYSLTNIYYSIDLEFKAKEWRIGRQGHQGSRTTSLGSEIYNLIHT